MHQPFDESTSAKIIPLNSGGETPAATAPAPVPFQAQIPPVASPSTPNTLEPVTSPHDVLRQLERKAQQPLPADRKKLFAYVAGGLLAWQVLIPAPLNPVGIVASIVGGFWLAVGGTTAETEQIRKLEENLADLKARKMEAQGNCSYGDYFGNIGSVCRNAVDRRFDGQIAAIESELKSMKPKSISEILFGD